MTDAWNLAALNIAVGGAQITLQNVQVQEGVLLDEVRLEGTSMGAKSANAFPMQVQLDLGEVHARIALSEPNLNRLIAAHWDESQPIRNLKVSLNAGKAKITGHYVKSVLSLPFTTEVTLGVHNGNTLEFDLVSVQVGGKIGMSLPTAVVETLKQSLRSLLQPDFSKIPFPLYLQEIRCEPGRLTLIGKARISFPIPLPETKP